MGLLEYTKVPVKKLYCHWGQTRGVWRLSWVSIPSEKKSEQQFCVHRVLFEGLYFTYKVVKRSIKACVRDAEEAGFSENEEHLAVLAGYLKRFIADVEADETLV